MQTSQAPPVQPRPSKTHSSSSSAVNSNSDDSSLDDDPVVRSIDVFMSPTLSSTMTLLQFPLLPRRTPRTSNFSSSFLIPDSVRHRPAHNMLELDYPLPPMDSSAAALQDSSARFNMRGTRTLKSHAVSLHTHMALAGWSGDGHSLFLTPLSRPVVQMRPTFAHIDAADKMNSSTQEDEHEEEEKKKKSKPQLIGLKNAAAVKSKSEQGAPGAVNIRQTFADKVAKEESEEWTVLNVYGPGTPECRDTRRLAESCLDSNIPIQFWRNPNQKKSQDSRSDHKKDGRNYIQTLNYLPPTANTNNLDDDDDDMVDDAPDDDEDKDDVNIMLNPDDDDDDENIKQKDKKKDTLQNIQERRNVQMIKNFSAKIATQMVHSGGSPIPYLLLKNKFIVTEAHKTDEHRLRCFSAALSGSATLLRGSCFVLKSSLMTSQWLTKKARDARDVILILLNRDGIVQREKLLNIDIHKYFKEKKKDGEEKNNVYDEEDDDSDEEEEDLGTASLGVKTEVIEYLLSQVACKGNNCWEMKYFREATDDNMYERDFPNEAVKHHQYWKRREKALQEFIDNYDDTVAED